MGSRGNGSSVDKGVDFANYFCTYAYLYHQKEMLSDRVRMDAYFNAVFQNKHHFKDKVKSFLSPPNNLKGNFHNNPDKFGPFWDKPSKSLEIPLDPQTF